MTEIFNTSKSREQYESSAIFLNPPPGLIDTVNKNFPKIWDLYNEMRALDWSENEFDFSTCANDFETAPKDIVEMMIKTLAFQWEADSIASQAPTVIIAPFSPATEVWAAEQRITDNEQCLTERHEVFVKDKGWISIKDVQVGDITLNCNPETQEVSFSPVIKKIDRKNNERVFRYANKTGSFKQEVTEGHRMAVLRRRNIGGWVKVQETAREVTPHGLVRFIVSGNKLTGKESITDEDRLWIAFQADGHHDKKYNGARTGFKPMGFTLKKERKKERLRNLLSRLPYEWQEKERNGYPGYSIFSIKIPVNKWRAGGKDFDWVDLENVSSTWAREFLDETSYWDGSRKRNQLKHGKKHVSEYYTKNKTCAEIVCTLAHIAGMRALSWLSNNGLWQIRINDKWHVVGGGIYRTELPHEDRVYCIQVAEDGFLTRLEDCITVTHNCHANCYSEIVRNSFADPKAVLEEILEVQESFRRLDLVNGTLGNIKKISQEVGYKGIDSFEREFLHEILIRFYFAMLILERIQFMASFAITFTIAKAGYFQEIGQAVKKIAQDEFEVHCEYRKEVLRELIKMGNGQQIFDRIKDELTALVEEAIESETVWTKDFLFKERSLVGTNADLVVQWVKFCAADVVRTFDLPIDMTDWPTANPMPHLEEWLNPNILQVAPQEQTVSAYKLNVVSKDIADDEFDF